MCIYQSDDFGVDYKADDSPLTKADKASHELISQRLSALTPDIAILSEEGDMFDLEQRKNLRLLWVVDPLDGTKEFVKRNGEFTVNIALLEDASPILGVVAVPAKGMAFYAAKGLGAWKIENSVETKIQAASFDLKDEGLTIVASRSHSNEESERFISKFKLPKRTSVGSALKFMLVAEGSAHVYPRLSPCMEWDTAAAQVIVEEAGGSVCDYTTNEPLRYNKPDLLSPYFICLGKVIHRG